MTAKRDGIPPLPQVDWEEFREEGSTYKGAFILGAEWATFHALLDTATVEGVFFPFELVVHGWLVPHCIDVVNEHGLLVDATRANEGVFRLSVARYSVLPWPVSRRSPGR